MPSITPPVLTTVKTPSSTPSRTTGPNRAIAPRMRGYDEEAWYQRAVELAENQHIDGTLLFCGIFDGDLLYTATSASNPYTRHRLRLDLERGFLSCDCIAHQHGYPCGHLGALYLLMLQALRSALPNNLRAQRQYEAWCATLDAS